MQELTKRAGRKMGERLGEDWSESIISSYSAANGNCVEVVAWPEDSEIGVRDAKDPTGPRFRLTAAAWAGFLLDVKDGQFDFK